MTTVILCGKTGTLHFLPCCFLCFLHTVGFVFVRELRGRKGSGAVLAAGLRTSSGQQLGQRDPFVQEELPLLRRKKGGVWIGPCFSSSHAGAAVFLKRNWIAGDHIRDVQQRYRQYCRP